MNTPNRHPHGPLTKLHASADIPLFHPLMGLPELYLAGIDYWVCPKCGESRALIPALDLLPRAIARALVTKLTALSGVEIEFLRNALDLKSNEFAKILCVTPQHFSRWENSRSVPSPPTDRLIRLSYVFLSGDEKLNSLLSQRFAEWSASIRPFRQPTRILAEYDGVEPWIVRLLSDLPRAKAA